MPVPEQRLSKRARDARERLSASTGLKKAESLGLIEIVERDRTGRSDDEDS